VCKLPGEPFDFLGYTIVPCYRPRRGRALSPATVARRSPASAEISALTGSEGVATDSRFTGSAEPAAELLVELFSASGRDAAYLAVDYTFRDRLRRWLCRKHGVDSRGSLSGPRHQHLYDVRGLVRLCAKNEDLLGAKA